MMLPFVARQKLIREERSILAMRPNPSWKQFPEIIAAMWRIYYRAHGRFVLAHSYDPGRVVNFEIIGSDN